MSRNFTLDDLPDRYRSQVLQQLGERSKATQLYNAAITPSSSAPPTENKEVSQKKKSEKGASRRRISSPVRFSKRNLPNETEAKFNREFLDNAGVYEAVSFNLPSGAKYTPDWLATDPTTGKVVFWEIKGGYHLGSHGRAVLAFKETCVSFPMFTFAWAELLRDGSTWNIGIYRNGTEVKSISGNARTIKAGGELSA